VAVPQPLWKSAECVAGFRQACTDVFICLGIWRESAAKIAELYIDNDAHTKRYKQNKHSKSSSLQ